MPNNSIMNKNDKAKYNLYLEAAKTALNNASLLYDEASLLIDVNHFARGFALCVLSLEESSKAFLFRYISLNLHNETKTLKLIRDHEKKLYQSALILSTSFKTILFSFEILKTMLEALKDKQHLANLKNKFDKNKLERFRKGIAMLNHLHRKRLDSIYVDIREGKIIDPNQSLSKKQIKEISDLAEVQHDIVKNVVTSKDDMLIQISKVMPLSPFEEDNPKDYSETMKELLKFMNEIKRVTNSSPDL